MKCQQCGKDDIAFNHECDWIELRNERDNLKRASLELARICKEHVTSGRRHDLYSAVVLFEEATGLKVETEP